MAIAEPPSDTPLTDETDKLWPVEMFSAEKFVDHDPFRFCIIGFADSQRYADKNYLREFILDCALCLENNGRSFAHINDTHGRDAVLAALRDYEEVVMTPEEKLYRAFEEHVDPETYHGACNCLIQQTYLALFHGIVTVQGVQILANSFGLSGWTVEDIYFSALHDANRNDYHAAMAMARRILGLTNRSEPAANDTKKTTLPVAVTGESLATR